MVEEEDLLIFPSSERCLLSLTISRSLFLMTERMLAGSLSFPFARAHVRSWASVRGAESLGARRVRRAFVQKMPSPPAHLEEVLHLRINLALRHIFYANPLHLSFLCHAAPRGRRWLCFSGVERSGATSERASRDCVEASVSRLLFKLVLLPGEGVIFSRPIVVSQSQTLSTSVPGTSVLSFVT